MTLHNGGYPWIICCTYDYSVLWYMLSVYAAHYATSNRDTAGSQGGCMIGYVVLCNQWCS